MVDVDFMEVEHMADIINFKAFCFHSFCLGVPVGHTINKKEAWQPLVTKFQKKKDGKTKMCSMGVG